MNALIRKKLAQPQMFARTNIEEVRCPSCGAVFYRPIGELKHGTRCPACHLLLIYDEKGLHVREHKQYQKQMSKKELYSPKYVKTYYNELKQHGKPFRTRMQWLSRMYGGKGGYTSEELYEIVTGKKRTSVYIFPYVKGAPPEVNRILEATYRRHRAEGASKVVAGIAAWKKVRQAGYVQTIKPQKVWIKRKANK